MRQAIVDVDDDVSIVCKPMADGGEGTLDALSYTSESPTYQNVVVTGPVGKHITVPYMIKNGHIAVIESAQIVGLPSVPNAWQHPDHTTSFGIGEVMLDALEKGCTKLLIGLGGSATNDGGMGMLHALGMEVYDADGRELSGFGKDLLQVSQLSVRRLDTRLKKVTIQVANDVDNPLVGVRGASQIYGEQKGLSISEQKQYDKQMGSFASLMENAFQQSWQNTPGTGAAGGLGFAFLALGAAMESGAKLVAREIQLKEAIQHADAVLTGEGKSDRQTLYGKAPGYVGSLAKKHGVDAFLISGALDDDIASLTTSFKSCSSLLTPAMTVKESITNVHQLLYERTREVFQHYQTERNT